MENTNREFELLGLNHVAMVCKDMQRTMDFYTNILGMKLIRTLDLPGGSGQHFFFDMGGGQCFAFFWFPEAPDRNPGVSNPRANIDPATALTDPTGFLSSHGSMNHFAFDVAPEKIAEYRDKLIAKGVQVSSFMQVQNGLNGEGLILYGSHLDQVFAQVAVMAELFTDEFQ